MKKSEIEKQLKSDLSSAARSDFETVWNKCAEPDADGKRRIAEPVPVTAHDGRGVSSGKKAYFIVAVAAAICLVLVLCVLLLGKTGEGFVLPSESGYFTIDVNPSLQVNYDKGGVVTGARALNGDGEEFLDGLELEGKTYDLAVNEIFERFVADGYFTEGGDNAMLMTASKDGGGKDEKMTAEINKLFSDKFEKNKLSGVVISDVDNAKWQKEAEKYGINGQKYDFIQRYLQLGGKLDESEYESVTIRELYSLITELEKGLKDK